MNQFALRTHQANITPENEARTVEVLMRDVPVPHHAYAGVAMLGTGNNNRTILEAAKASEKCLLVAGYHEEDVVERDFTVRAVSSLTGFDPERLRVQGVAKHAGQQAEWIADNVKEFGITNFTLHTSSFHMQRAWRTVLESLRRRDILIPVFPVPVTGNPYEIRFLENTSGIRKLREVDIIAGEEPRLRDYQKTKTDGTPGDVATLEWMQDVYLPWLYEKLYGQLKA